MNIHTQNSLAGKHISFFLNGEEFCINILNIQEIIQTAKITSIPQSADYIDGIINLRNKVIPVINLRSKLGMERAEDNYRNCIIIVHSLFNDKIVTAGLQVDEVSEVIDIKEDDIEQPSSILKNHPSSQAIIAMAKHEDGVKPILEIEYLLDHKLLESIKYI